MFRPGSHNPHTVYWSEDSGPDRFVCTAMSSEAAVGIASLLNSVVGPGDIGWVATLPMVPRREVSPKSTVRFSGGPWDGKTTDVASVVGPVFAVGDQVGNHYWLDTKGRTGEVTYYWDGTEWDVAP